MFRELLNAWLHFPCDKDLLTVLDRYYVKLHQLTPNAIIQLVLKKKNAIIQLFKFFWPTKCFGSEIDIDAFVRFHELHYRKRVVSFEGSAEKSEAQFGYCNFVAR